MAYLREEEFAFQHVLDVQSSPWGRIWQLEAGIQLHVAPDFAQKFLEVLETAHRETNTAHPRALCDLLGRLRLCAGDVEGAFSGFIEALTGSVPAADITRRALRVPALLDHVDARMLEYAAFCAFLLAQHAKADRQVKRGNRMATIGRWLASEAVARGYTRVGSLSAAGVFDKPARLLLGPKAAGVPGRMRLVTGTDTTANW